MSKEGMLRPILGSALTQVPSLTAAIFPERWQWFRLLGGDVNSWTLPELISAFELLLQQASNKLKICLFIDGLDDFDGDHSDLNDIIRAAVQHPCIKACLASRPWPVFEDDFSTHPSLMLQHLTYSDIVAYSEEKPRSHPGFLALQRQEPYYTSCLIESIAVQSDGVFLWVFLVVRSLMAGLSNSDRISDSQRRLEDLPSDLEDLYQKMFDSIEPFYVSGAYQLLSLARDGQGSLTALALSFADEEDATLATKREVIPIEDDEKLNRYESIKRRLSGCCKGFLEIPYLACSGEDMVVNDIPAQDEPAVGVIDGIESTAQNPPDPVGLASLCPTGSMDPSLPDESAHEDLEDRSLTPPSDPDRSIPGLFEQLEQLYETSDFRQGRIPGFSRPYGGVGTDRGDRKRQQDDPWLDSHESTLAYRHARHTLSTRLRRREELTLVNESLRPIRDLIDPARMAVEQNMMLEKAGKTLSLKLLRR